MTKLLAAIILGTLLFAETSLACSKNDLKGIIGCYSPSKPNWHSYEVPATVLCKHSENPNCTFPVVKNAFLRNVMPCQEASHKITPGEILSPKDPVTGCLYSPGHVKIGIHKIPHGVAVTILTLPGHSLYDGVVLRYLIEKRPGVFVVYTRGIGNNLNWFWSKTNEEVGPTIFRKQNRILKDYLQECFIGRESCR
jgi:hypothetical protein